MRLDNSPVESFYGERDSFNQGKLPIIVDFTQKGGFQPGEFVLPDLTGYGHQKFLFFLPIIIPIPGSKTKIPG